MQSWERLQSLFFTALALEPAERSHWLDALSGTDEEAAREVAGMLAAHDANALRIEAGLDVRDGHGIPAPFEPGTIVGPYRIDALLGTGGMAHVYRADRVDGLYEQSVALKVLRPGYHAAEFIRLFESERHILGRLQHPAIAAILGGGTTAQGLPWLAVQLVDGTPITTHCIERDVPLRDRLRLFARVCEAVQFAHARLIVHRDLKASNILVTAAGEPILLDFGIAKLLSSDPDTALYTPTRTGVMILTPEHAAPEQLAGEPVSTATDVYALGLLLLELLTDRRATRAGGRSGSDGLGPTLRRYGHGDIASDVDRIVAMALREDPTQRYASAGHLADDITRCLDGLPVRAQPDSARYRARKFARRHRVPLTVAAAIALLLAGSTIASLVQARRVAAERDAAASQRERAEAVIGVLTSLFETANPYVVPGGDTLRLAAFLEQAEAEVERLGAQPELQARMWQVLGNMHVARSGLEHAVELLRRSHALHVDLFGEEDARTARVAHDLGNATLAFNGGAEAVPLLRESSARLARLLGVGHDDAVLALQDLAIATYDPETRDELLSRVAALRTDHGTGNPTSTAALLNAQASVYYERSRYAEALALYRQSAAILDSVMAPDHPNRLTVDGNTVATLTALGRYDEAEPLARSVLTVRARMLGPESSAVAAAREALATTLANLGRHEEADSLFREALAGFELSYAPGHSRTASALRNVAMIAVLRGEPERGLALLDSAIALAPDGSGRAFMRVQRATALLRLERIDQARAVVSAASDDVFRLTPDGHAYRSAISALLGRIALTDDRPEEAEVRYGMALSARRRLLPPEHPEVLEAECGLTISRALLASATMPAEPPAPCTLYARWGRADPFLPRLVGITRVEPTTR